MRLPDPVSVKFFPEDLESAGEIARRYGSTRAAVLRRAAQLGLAELKRQAAAGGEGR